MKQRFARKFTTVQPQCWLASGMSLLVIAASFWTGSKAVASEPNTLLLLTTPLNEQQVNQLWAGNVPTDRSIIAANTVSQSDLTIPSLWWAQKQFGGTLLNYWVAYSGADGAPRRIDLLVDQQVWNGTSYIDRYAFITQMGETAKDFDYNLRVFTWRGDLLGAYVCDFSAPNLSNSGTIAPTEDSRTVSQCDVFLGLSDPGTFQNNPLPAAP
ncbi:MAG: hypothetical protein KME15_21535 [Drouetiella hepatica Uher 2000/2452]|jgi:hypothetical protein|uniref:Uncharacterized protein n=1 Tax=Drouetiella hepatica Uher 2000/2452 TaxID=904376 RepID=A0A951UPF3_9CYAN|nr:hypothetical protein [Drouetiella hepatica Uher 2000/2452]